MAYENRKYMIIPFADVTTEMTDNAMENPAYLRHSISGVDRVILKYEGDTPEVFDGFTTYTNAEMKAILNDPDGDWWSAND